MKFTTNATTFIKRPKIPREGLLVDDRVKVHLKFGILCVHLSSNSVRQTCFLSIHTWRPIPWQSIMFFQDSSSSFRASQTPENRSACGDVPRELLRLATSTISEYLVMPGMTNNI